MPTPSAAAAIATAASVAAGGRAWRRYVKVTLSIRRHRGGLPDEVKKSYQFADQHASESKRSVSIPCS